MKRRVAIGIAGSIITLLISGCDYREKVTKDEMESYKKLIVFDEAATETVEAPDANVSEGTYVKCTGFVSDKYLCNEGSASYEYKGNNDQYHTITIKVNSSDVYSDKNQISEYFAGSTQYIDLFQGNEENESTYADAETVYVVVNVTIKNVSGVSGSYSIGNYKIVEISQDKSGERYGLSTNKAVTLSGEFDYDYRDEKNDIFYFLSLDAGQEINTNLCFKIPRDKAAASLYFFNGESSGTYVDNLKKIEVSNESSQARYIKLEIYND